MSNYYQHRGSIFWALILIAIGTLFLLQNFYPTVHPWHVLAKFWPLLIIFWGISKLVDYFQWRSQPQTGPASLFSAGDVVLLILILIFGTLISKFVLTPWHEWPGALGLKDENFADLFLNSYTFTKRVSQDVNGSPHLLLVNRKGNIEVHGSEQPQFAGVVQTTIWAENEAAARRRFDQLDLKFVENSGQYELTSNRDSLPHGGRNIRLDFQLQVPRATSLQLTGNNGDITITGLKGEQNLSAQKGNARASEIAGLVRVHASGGSMEIRNIQGSVQADGRGGDVAIQDVSGTVAINGDFSGDMQFEKIAQALHYSSSRTNLNVRRIAGRLTMNMGTLEARGIEGPFELATRDKDVNLENFKYDVNITDQNGDVRLRTATPPSRPIEIDLKKGNINLALPASSPFRMEAVSQNGDVSSDFPGLEVDRGHGSPSIKGSSGKGGPLIRLSSTYGTIRIVRENSQPAPPSTTAFGGRIWERPLPAY